MPECIDDNLGHSPCGTAEEDRIFDVYKCYVGLVEPYGSIDIGCFECQHGGTPCHDWPAEQTVLGVVGQSSLRWLLPDKAPYGFGRSANGKYYDLRSGIPVRVLSRIGTHFSRASCYDKDGIECHGYETCDCWPHLSLALDTWVGDTEYCSHAHISNNQLVPGLHPDLFGYQKRLDEAPFCKHFINSNKHDQQIASQGRDLHEPSFFRSGGPWECIADPMLLCAGRVHQGNNPCSYHAENPEAEYYNPDTNSLNRFRHLKIAGNPHIRTDPSSVTPERATAIVKNAVLNYVLSNTFPGGANGITFDNLDKQEKPASSSSYYKRTWNYPLTSDELIDIESLPVVARYPDCYIRNTGTPVPIELRICGVSIELSLDIIQSWWFTEWADYRDIDKRRRHPHVRIKILAQCCWIAELPDAVTLVRPWIPEDDPDHEVFVEVVNPHVYSGARPEPDFIEERWPHVRSPDSTIPMPWLDEVVFVDNDGRVFDPFNDVLWLGYLGRFSSPQTDDLFPYNPSAPGYCGDYVLTPESYCEQLACHFQGVRVGGWPYSAHDNIPDNSVYDGELVLSF